MNDDKMKDLLKNSNIQKAEKGFYPAFLIYFPLPYRNAGKEFVRKVNGATLEYYSKTGVPYGKYGRLVASFLISEAKRNGQTIDLGRVTQTAHRLGLDAVTGKRIKRLSDVFEQFAGLFITVSERAAQGPLKGVRKRYMALSEELQLLWDSRGIKGNQLSLFDNYLQFSDPFYDLISHNAFLINQTLLMSMNSARQQDIYLWAVRRSWKAEEQLIRWNNLYEQFGPIPRQLKPRFRDDATKSILLMSEYHFDDIPVRVTEEGIIFPGKSPKIAEKDAGYAL